MEMDVETTQIAAACLGIGTGILCRRQKKRRQALANGFNVCFNIHSNLLNAVERLLNDVERWDGQKVSTFHSTKLSEWPGN